jgi:hypothetical protein
MGEYKPIDAEQAREKIKTFLMQFHEGHWFSMMGTVLPFEIITYAI